MRTRRALCDLKIGTEAYNYRIGNRRRVSQIPIHRVDGHDILVIQDQYCDLIQEPNWDGFYQIEWLCTLEMARDVLECRGIAVDVKSATIGGIVDAQLFLEEAWKVRWSYSTVWARIGSASDRRQRWQLFVGIDQPSELIEAPDNRNRSEPIWIEKTFSGGKEEGEADPDMIHSDLILVCPLCAVLRTE